jgi:pimeloyl-ACP methyl ester carboxylesterase
LAENSLALAELVYKNGFSAVSISSPFNSEFMENASTVALPAYLPTDGHDLQVALTAVDHRLNQLYPGRLGEKALLGYSMGAFQSLFVAATSSTNQSPMIKFDRYVAISPPVRLLHGVAKLDEFYRAPLDWPLAQRADNLENTFLKVAALSKLSLTPRSTLPFSAIESKFLIGMTFRFMLRDIIYSSQHRYNQGVLHHPLWNWRREPAYREILEYSFQDYFDKFATPYYETHGLGSSAGETLKTADDLRTYDAGLRANPKIRIIVNQNDFLLADEDLAWLHDTFPPGQLDVFKQGGHLGNLTNPTVQKTIINALADLKSPQPKP